MSQPKVKYTVSDYMSTPEGTRYQLLDGDMVLAPAPGDKHQVIVGELLVMLLEFVRRNRLGAVRVSPYDVVLSEHDVAQPDLLYVSRERSGIITKANIQGAPDLVVEVISPGSARYDRGYKRILYGRAGVREYWLVDPLAEVIEVLVPGGEELVRHGRYGRGETLESPLLPGFNPSLDRIFQAE